MAPPASEPGTGRPSLRERVPSQPIDEPDEILDRFLDWVAAIGFELYPAQEEALLEIMAGRHVVLGTPTGSGKSLVALGLHFKGLCEGRTSVYTSPIKALASEKFFSLCDDLGADEVGMLTGDASINPDGRVLACTAEVLANMALRRGEALDVPYVVMDEFHYYADRDRGVAWQVPLITLPRTQFLLMSATLGDMTAIADKIERFTSREVAIVATGERPVPLDYSYRETPLHETVDDLVRAAKAPIYVVNFSQRECAELAQSLTSLSLAEREDRDRVRDEIKGARFDTPYGRELRRFLGFGLGVHHAGLLPKYRLMVEQLAQKGLLKVISGTDTLGVGVNIPIRTVLFTKLAKYDGRKITQLRVRDFQQIAGRAGRRGFDVEGSVVCQAPDWVIDNLQAERKAAGDPKKLRKLTKKRPEAGAVSWSKETFDNLVSKPPEKLVSRFRVTDGMVLDLLQRDAESNDPEVRNFASLRALIRDCHDEAAGSARHLAHAARVVRSLHRAGIIRMVRDTASRYYWAVVDEDLQFDFSLFHNLSLFLVEALEALDPEQPDYALDLVSLVEAVLEDPGVILRQQVDRAKTELLAQLKADGVSYEERVQRLDEVAHPQPGGDRIRAAYDLFRSIRPWLGPHLVSPKSIGREMLEAYHDFGDYVRLYGLQRTEGVLLRYVSQLYKTLEHNVPDAAKTEPVWDVIGFFRSMLERVDTSLIEEWESLLHPELRLSRAAVDAHDAHRLLALEELLTEPRKRTSRVRAEVHRLVRALSRREWEEASGLIRQDEADAETLWPPERLEAALAPFFERFSGAGVRPPSPSRRAHPARAGRRSRLAGHAGAARPRGREPLVPRGHGGPDPARGSRRPADRAAAHRILNLEAGRDLSAGRAHHPCDR